ncbi:guanine nucleotide exchange factor vps9 [Stagonosporopsis vannaccii]|nr:guanine nucleotide exchange factor vps9 [Stagonosporopsis vannaccii]
MSPPNEAPQPAATQDRSHEEPLRDAREERAGGVMAPAGAAAAAGGAEKQAEGEPDWQGGDTAGQPAAGHGERVDDRAQAADTALVERAEAPAPVDEVKPDAAPEEPTSAELIEQLTAKTQEIALESSPRRAPTPTPTPTPTEKAAGKAPVRSPSPPPPPPKDDKYLGTSNGPSRSASPLSSQEKSGRNSEDAAAADYTAKLDGGEDVAGDDQSEIQSIMEQFEHSGGPQAEEIMSPRLEFANPLLESPAFPPRRSSLAPVDKPLPTPQDDTASVHSLQSPPPRTSSLYRVGTNTSFVEPTSPSAHASQYKPAQPAPEPEPDLPFDFHRFLEQLRHRTADPVAKFLRSFLLEFGKKQWMVHEQVKIIGDFLEFISKKMAQCEVWRTVSDAEFDNAREGMEKLVMNRLYNQTFSPAIPPPEPLSPRKGRRRQEPPGPGRRGQHQEDVERDEVLAQKVRIYKWVREEHLDIKDVGEKGRKFLALAQQELLKIKTYRAPRDKIICILNCCKVIFGFLRTSKSDQSADAFVPLLIYTVLQANPDHLVSNVQYILRFRNQDKLGGEAGYYISSLMGAVQFIEGLDKTSLTVTDEEFDRNVEAAVKAIAEKHAPEAEIHPESAAGPAHLHPTTSNHRRMPSPHYHHVSEKSSPSRPEVITRNSMEAQTAGPRRSTSLRDRRPQDPPPEEENAAVAGLLRTIQRPLSTIGRIFSDNDTTASSSAGSIPRSSSTPLANAHHQQHPGHERFPGAAPPSNTYSEKGERPSLPPRVADEDRAQQQMRADDHAARQASAEVEQARRIQVQEQRVVVETLTGMFPQLDREVIEDVVREKEGRVGLAVDACLALANP